MINIENLKATSSTDQLILNNISMNIPTGRITTIIGKSGCGKTTLLRTIAGIQTIGYNGRPNMQYEGKITVDGKDLANLDRAQQAATLGFVFQDFNLFENLNVLDNCTQPLVVVKNISPETAQFTAQKMLADLGMDSFLSYFPKNLSGGQKQRVAIARALCMGPKAILLDEPTSALDPENTKNLCDLLKNLCQRGICVLISSQDMQFVNMVSDNIYLIEDGMVAECFDIKASEKFSDTSKIGKFLKF